MHRIFSFMSLAASAGILGQMVLLIHQGELTLYRGAALLLGIGLLLGRKRLTGRFITALLSAGFLWTTVLELCVTHTLLLARGFLLVALGFAVHFALLYLGSASSRKDGFLRRAAKRLTLLVTAVVVAVSLAECLSRALIPLNLHEIVPDDPAQGPLFLTDSQSVVRRARPGFRGKYMHPEFMGLEVAINEYGFRDGTDETGPLEEGERSVMVLGDSFAFGTGVRLEETFQEQLESRAAQLGVKALRVFNTALPGFGQVAELEILKEFGPVFAPEVVILCVFEGNDFQDNVEAETRLRQGLPLWVETPAGQEPESSTLGRYLKGLGRSSYWFGSSALVQVLFYRFEKILVRLGLMNPILATTQVQNEMFRENPNEVIFYAMDRTCAVLERIQETCAGLGASLVVLDIPSIVQAEPERFRLLLERMPPERRAHMNRRCFHDRFIGALKERGFKVVDLLDRLEEQAVQGRSCYHLEGHWNARGHTLAADALVPVLAGILNPPGSR